MPTNPTMPSQKFHRVRFRHERRESVLIHRDNEDPDLVFLHLSTPRLRLTEAEAIALCNALADEIERPQQ